MLQFKPIFTINSKHVKAYPQKLSWHTTYFNEFCGRFVFQCGKCSCLGLCTQESKKITKQGVVLDCPIKLGTLMFFFLQIQHQIINCMSIYTNTIIETGKQLKLYLCHQLTSVLDISAFRLTLTTWYSSDICNIKILILFKQRGLKNILQ